MADQAPTLELATNIPCRANLKYVNWRSTSNGERLKFVVDVVPGQEQYSAGKQEAWASIDFEAPMVQWGLIQRSGEHNGKPDFKVINTPAIVLHMREKKGDKGKTVKYLTLGVERSGQVQYFDPSATAAEAPVPAPAPAAPAPSTPAPSNGNSGGHGQPPSMEELRTRTREQIMAIADLHFACELLVRERRATVGADGKRQELALELPLEQSDAAMVNSLFIEMSKSHVNPWPGIHREIKVLLQRRREGKPAAPPPPPPPPPAPAPRPAPARAAAGPGMESFADFPEALDGDDDDLPF